MTKNTLETVKPQKKISSFKKDNI